MDNITYIIKKESEIEYKVAKFIDGNFEAEYIVIKRFKKWECNCMSGSIRHYCKHKDWINIVRRNATLPCNVQLSQTITNKDMENFVKENEKS